MLAEVRLLIAPKEARLILKKGERLVEEEIWSFDRKISQTEAKEIADVMFHDCYDLVQYSVYGE